MGTNPGKRNRTVSIRRKLQTKRADGSPQEGYEIVAENIKGQFRTETGLSTIRASNQGSGNIDIPTRYSLRVAFRRDVARGMEAVDTFGTVFQVMNVRHDLAGRQWTDLILEEGAA